MRPGPWDPYAPSSFASSTHSPILIISTLSPLLRTSGALSELFFPTATVPTALCGPPLHYVNTGQPNITPAFLERKVLMTCDSILRALRGTVGYWIVFHAAAGRLRPFTGWSQLYVSGCNPMSTFTVPLYTLFRTLFFPSSWKPCFPSLGPSRKCGVLSVLSVLSVLRKA